MDGLWRFRNETDALQPHRATKAELRSFLEVVDIGRSFKQVDQGVKKGRAPSFVMAEDVRKVYPDG